MTTTEPEIDAAAEWMKRRRQLFGIRVTTTVDLAAVTIPPGTRTMVDSAWPLRNPPQTDIVLIYAGGDTPHPWTQAEIDAQPARYRWPCWVRSNPGQVNAAADAANCIKWLASHAVPRGTSVILDLETAVNGPYVSTFSTLVKAAGWLTTKYGSRSSIWRNPQTSGGTFLAEPGPPHMSTVGDTVATQWGYFGAYDMSWVKDQATIPLWDTRPPQPPAPIPDWELEIMNRLPVVKYGDNDKTTGHRWVRRVQGLLLAYDQDLGTSGPRHNGIDGIYGPATRAAVRFVLAQHGVTSDGMQVDRNGWAVLDTGAGL